MYNFDLIKWYPRKGLEVEVSNRNYKIQPPIIQFIHELDHYKNYTEDKNGFLARFNKTRDGFVHTEEDYVVNRTENPFAKRYGFPIRKKYEDSVRLADVSGPLLSK